MNIRLHRSGTYAPLGVYLQMTHGPDDRHQVIAKYHIVQDTGTPGVVTGSLKRVHRGTVAKLHLATCALVS